MQIGATVFLAGRLGLGSHATLANDAAQTEIADHLPLVRLFTDGSRGTGGRADIAAIGLLHHHRAAVIDDAVAKTHAGRQFAAFVQILVHGIAAGEYNAGNQNLVADFQRTDLFLGKGQGQFGHGY